MPLEALPSRGEALARCPKKHCVRQGPCLVSAQHGAVGVAVLQPWANPRQKTTCLVGPTCHWAQVLSVCLCRHDHVLTGLRGQ